MIRTATGHRIPIISPLTRKPKTQQSIADVRCAINEYATPLCHYTCRTVPSMCLHSPVTTRPSMFALASSGSPNFKPPPLSLSSFSAIVTCRALFDSSPKQRQMLRAKTFVFMERNGGRLFDWWEEIDESEKWQQGIYYALSASYALISFVALVQLFRIQLRVPEYGWTTQKLFHLMNFVVNGLRAVMFGLYKGVFLLRPKAFEMVLLDLPGLLFFSTYTLLVLFWAEIYHQARSLPIDKLRPSYYLINGFIYFTQVCIWIYIRLSQSPVAVEVAKLFFSVVSFCAALGFLIYGGRLFFMLRRFPIESRGRQKKLNEVGFVTGICCTCFLIRCVVVALSAFDKDADVDVLDHPILNFIYYMLVEIVPSALVLFILRKLPPRRFSDQYHPIQ